MKQVIEWERRYYIAVNYRYVQRSGSPGRGEYQADGYWNGQGWAAGVQEALSFDCDKEAQDFLNDNLAAREEVAAEAA